MLTRALHILAMAAFVGYPLAVFYGVRTGRVGLWMLLACVCLAPTLYFRLRRAQQTEGAPHIAALRPLAMLPLVTLAMLALSAAAQARGFALATPTIINAVLLVVFGTTLRTPMPMIERFARLIDPELTEAQRRWCRQWTIVWCAFFFANGTLAALLALWAPLLWWSLYTSLIAYIVMGTLFATERAGRWYKFERQGSALSSSHAGHHSEPRSP